MPTSHLVRHLETFSKASSEWVIRHLLNAGTLHNLYLTMATRGLLSTYTASSLDRRPLTCGLDAEQDVTRHINVATGSIRRLGPIQRCIQSLTKSVVQRSPALHGELLRIIILTHAPYCCFIRKFYVITIKFYQIIIEKSLANKHLFNTSNRADTVFYEKCAESIKSHV